ncbi:hypothetical protein [Streptomyces longispororuber]|uniref:hypothetical protein n=1 Tax=Streptomyces longispororuber TaxID=68230 RepID=UPI00210CE107|nr:hypothetical protein [Streptomyces longispororuber]MCQ4213871.1 hypothetical protein [Streptomyces longispororuber]
MVNLSEVGPLFVVAGAVVTSVAAYRGVLLTTMTSVRTSASTRQFEAIGDLLGVIGKIQRSGPADLPAARREFQAAYELVQRTAPEPSDILAIADEMNELVRAVARAQLETQTPSHVSVLFSLRSNAARDDDTLERTGFLGRRHSRDVLDEVLRLHAEQEVALAEGRQAPDPARARAALVEDGWDELEIDEFLACGARKRAQTEKAVSAGLEEVGKALSGLAAAKGRLIAAERSWVNNLASPVMGRRRKVPRLLSGRR